MKLRQIMCIALALLLISCVTVSAFADIEIEIPVGGDEPIENPENPENPNPGTDPNPGEGGEGGEENPGEGGEENPGEGGEEEEEAPVAATAPAVLSRVVNEDNKYVAHSYETVEGVMTVTSLRDFASFTNKLGAIKTLSNMGVEKIVFVTNGATSEFAVADLLEKSEDLGVVFALTHDGETVTFVIDETDVSDILAA